MARSCGSSDILEKFDFWKISYENTVAFLKNLSGEKKLFLKLELNSEELNKLNNFKTIIKGSSPKISLIILSELMQIN